MDIVNTYNIEINSPYHQEELTYHLSSLSQNNQVPDVYSLKKVARHHLETMDAEELDADWRLKDFFGHIKVISNKDSARYPQIVEEMAKVGISEDDFELSPTVKGADLPESLWSRIPDWVGEGDHRKKGHAGCLVAHYLLIKDTALKFEKARADYYRLSLQDPPATEEQLKAAQKLVKKYSSVLVIEDSNGFGLLEDGTPQLNGLGTVFRETMSQMPNNWDMFYFICMHGEWGPAKVLPKKPLLLKSTYGCVTKCFAINHTAYEAIVRTLESRMFDQSVPLPPVDHMLAELHKKTETYISKIPLAYRLNSVSLIQNDASTDFWQPIPR